MKRLLLRYLDDLLDIDNPYFDKIVSQIHPGELQIDKANSFDNGAPVLKLDLCIKHDIISSKNNDTRDYFDFKIS